MEPAPTTPSRLRPPSQRKAITSADVVLGGLTGAHANVNSAQIDSTGSTRGVRPKLESPKALRRSVPSLPAQLNIPVVSADGMSRTYRTSASVASRLAPVTKFINTRVNPRNLLQPTRSADGNTVELKNRLEEMEKMVEDMRKRMVTTATSSDTSRSQIFELEEQLRVSEDARKRLDTKLSFREDELESLGENFKKLKRHLQEEVDQKNGEILSLRNSFASQISETRTERDLSQQEAQNLKVLLSSSREELESLKQAGSLTESEAMIRALRLSLETLENNLQRKAAECDSISAALVETQECLRVATEKLHIGEALRRKLHNMVQELKGNIRVFCRVRPIQASEVPEGSNPSDLMKHLVIGLNNDEREEIQMIQLSEGASGNSVSKPYPFTFDKVFGPSSCQAEIFDEISQLVQSALDGYKVCIFAYGQTGSGKTFTMEGDRDDPTKIGMIPRAVRQIFATTSSLVEKGWMFQFQVSYLEIYNETIRDLLSSRSEPDLKLDIKHVDGKTHVTDLTVEHVDEPVAIFKFLAKAAQNRAVAETNCNERSSRSHSVFTLKITGDNAVTTEKVEGVLNLIDLAGSERLSQSGSTGDRLKETQAINKSLSALGDVIHAIANKEAHVPYRNSKLTYLLQTSLGGNCKTLMFVNVSPAISNFQESLCSLRFATKVNSCQIGTASKRVLK